MGKTEYFLKCHFQEKWLNVHVHDVIVASGAREVTEILTQRRTQEELLCEDYSDLSSAISNNMPNIQTAVYVVYNTLKKFIFMHTYCSYCLILYI